MPGEHVHLIDEIHLEAALAGQELRVVEEVAGVFNTGARRRVDLDQVHEAASRNLLACPACPAGLGGDARLAVETGREDARERGFADATGTGEQIGVMQALVVERVG